MELVRFYRTSIFKENRWSTASDFKKHFGRITCFISNKSTNCLGLAEAAVNKQLTEFALEIFMLYIYTYAVYLISFTLSQNDQNGEQIQKSQMFFLFFVLPNANTPHIY